MLKKPNSTIGKKSVGLPRPISLHAAMMTVARIDAPMIVTIILMIANSNTMTMTTMIGQRVLGKDNYDAANQTTSLLPSSSLVPSVIIACSLTRCLTNHAWFTRA